jgi:hypothetical protein
MAVCVNGLSPDEAKHRAGQVPSEIEWRAGVHEQIPRFLLDRLGAGMAEGVAWKFAPIRLFPDLHELALDNDVILWQQPAPLATWLERTDRALLSADVKTCFGRFTRWCGSDPRNSGIRGCPPGFDFEAALRHTLALEPGILESETDEQGMVVAALERMCEPLVVGADDVTICSPFHPHNPALGRCGAHFVGINSRRIPWDYYGRPAIECRTEHWDSLFDEIARRVDAECQP